MLAFRERFSFIEDESTRPIEDFFNPIEKRQTIKLISPPFSQIQAVHTALAAPKAVRTAPNAASLWASNYQSAIVKSAI